MYTVEEKIQIAQISQYLSVLDNLRLGLNAGGNDLRLPRKLYMIRKNVEWLYDLDNNDSTLLFTSNYLYALCGKYANAAARRINAGGTVAPITPTGAIINPLDWKVAATSTAAAPFKAGDIAVTFDGTNGNVDLRGYNLQFSRGGVTQNTTPLGDGSTYYYWNKVTGLFQLFGAAPTNGAAQLDELFRIMPDVVGGLTIENFNEPQTIFLDADGTYTLAEGYMIYKISIKPTVADTVKIGTTIGGSDIMFDKLMVVNVWGNNGVNADVYAESGDQTVYFTGFTGQAQINIYLLPVPE